MKSVVVGVVLAALPLALWARAEPKGDGELLPPVADVADGGAPVEPSSTGTLPDPAPLVTRHQWVLDLRYRSGQLRYGGARRVELANALATPRAMGRFGIELYVGRQLLERVRFDFPLLGSDELAGAPRRWDSPPSFERNLSTQAAVMIPHSERATRAVLVDRATGRAWSLPWPLAAARDAGAGRD